jgi:predicted Zn-dependent protease
VRVEFGARRFGEAEAAARGALAADPSNPLAQKFLGILLGRRGELEAARDLLRGAAAGQPTDASVQLELGRVEEQLGDPAAACQAYERAATGQGPAPLAARAAAAFRALGCP